MPSGKPKAGYRRRKNAAGEFEMPKKYTGGRKDRKARKVLAAAEAAKVLAVPANVNESDADIEKRIDERFKILSGIVDSAVQGEVPAVIVSGPAGVGKSFLVENKLKDWDPRARNYCYVKGYVKATGLYKTLYQYREKGNIVVFDDADTLFFDDTSLNMLKAVCDTNDTRTVSYLSDYNLVDEDGLNVPRTFDFRGTIIFITNLDFDALVDNSTKLAPHLQALMSRALYIDLMMKTRRDALVRIKQVLKGGMLRTKGVNAKEETEILGFIETNLDKMRELSLRSCLKVASVRKANPSNWETVAAVTCLKR